ncbi:hypothetical protein J2Y03_003461 [Neobacillus niacini]|uniref:phospholipase D-like domain-containing protein n=1 Tax=Neobacillus niacini TaxID=86668 RepID=UPI00285C00A3|nr:phospholipase D-like domain-containing protein [Neobacillus niacini]MDR7078409.1 hypothetical protein [Neobacillus niacini]
MSIESFFVVPGDNHEIQDRVFTDVKYAKYRVYVAMAFLEDNKLIEAIKQTKAPTKLVLNAQSIVDAMTRQYRPLDIYKSLGDKSVFISELGTKSTAGNSKKTHMHHKFVIVDDILWIGSYNFTNAADSRHWENMLRIRDPQLVRRFLKEFMRMYLLGKALEGKVHKGKPLLEHDRCTECDEQILDPFSHYCVIVKHQRYLYLREDLKYIQNINLSYDIKCGIELLICDDEIYGNHKCEICMEVIPQDELIPVYFYRNEDGDETQTEKNHPSLHRFCSICYERGIADPEAFE